MDFDFKKVPPIQMYKGLNVVMSFISLVIGLFSHYQSNWMKLTYTIHDPNHYGWMTTFDMYEICQYGIVEPMNFLKSCPDIAWERYFVSVVIICCILSLVNFLMEFIGCVNLKTKSYKIMDCVSHILAAVALIIAGILYILSALLIYDVLDLENSPVERHYRTVEKIVAAVFVFLQAICYGATAYQLRKLPPSTNQYSIYSQTV